MAMLKIVGIYKITSPSGKIYIGQSRDIAKRKSVYKTLKCEGQRLIFRSLKKYGFDDHIFEIIHRFQDNIDQQVLDQWEIFYINKYRTGEGCLLNLREGGRNYGSVSEESRKKISETHKRLKTIPPSRLGTILSPTHREALITSRKGKKNSEAHNLILKKYNDMMPREHIDRLSKMKWKTWVIYRDGVLLGRFLNAQDASDNTGISKKRIYSIATRQKIGNRSNKRTLGLKIFSE